MYKQMPQVKKYVENKLAGNNKMQSALMAGYSESSARKPALIEATTRYNEIVKQTLDTNAKVLQLTLDNVSEELHKDEKDWNKLNLMSQVASKLTGVHTALTPRVTLKESTDKNGNVTRTAWAQNASQVQEVMDDKE
jgi:hypothetical protein